MFFLLLWDKVKKQSLWISRAMLLLLVLLLMGLLLPLSPPRWHAWQQSGALSHPDLYVRSHCQRLQNEVWRVSVLPFVRLRNRLQGGIKQIGAIAPKSSIAAQLPKPAQQPKIHLFSKSPAIQYNK